MDGRRGFECDTCGRAIFFFENGEKKNPRFEKYADRHGGGLSLQLLENSQTKCLLSLEWKLYYFLFSFADFRESLRAIPVISGRPAIQRSTRTADHNDSNFW